MLAYEDFTHNRRSHWIPLVLFLMLAGCATQKPAPEVHLVWPPPPQKPRIEFVRSISSDRDVHQDTTFTQKVLDFLGGVQPPANYIVQPLGIAVSSDGQLVYVSDYEMNQVSVFDFANRTFRKIPHLARPAGLALDGEGNLYVVEQIKKQITVFNPQLKRIRTITDPTVERPVGIAIDRQRGRIYLADTAFNKDPQFTVKIFNMAGKLIGKLGHGRGNEPGQFMFPTFVALDREGNVYVTDSLNCRVEKFSPEGKYLRSFGGMGNAWGEFTRPKGVALDRFGNVYVVDSGWSNVQIFNQKGQILLFFGGRGPIPGMLKNPIPIAIDADDDIFVGDYLNHRIEEYKLINTTAASSYAGSADAPNPAAAKKPVAPQS
jgi:DNA-binding beta-propeller fold protein YncE